MPAQTLNAPKSSVNWSTINAGNSPHFTMSFFIWPFISRVLLAEGCDSPYLLGFLVELLQWRLEGEKDDAQVLLVTENLATSPFLRSP